MKRRRFMQTLVTALGYELPGGSYIQRWALAGFLFAWLVAAWWILFGTGLDTVGAWFGQAWTQGDLARRTFLGAGLAIYYVRVLFTLFVFLKRGVGWTEVFTVAAWVLCIFLVLGVAGGSNRESMGAAGFGGVVLFIAGSWINSSAEYARNVWKLRPENRGHLYTQGLFRFSRHPNYFGDLLSFSGLCLISEVWATVWIPLTMLAGFVFVNIPVLDSHLRDRYGAAFEEYARRTRKLIPFVY
jgi:steroid 5-alpha reductase family enzyme